MPPERLFVAAVLASALTACAGTGRHGAQASHDEARQAARVHTELGQSYMQQGALQAALGKLQMALKFDPDYAPAHTVIAALYERIGDTAQAARHYRRAQALKPADGDTNNNLGAFLCKEGKVAESLPYFKKALADPFYGTPDAAWSNAGVCERKLDDTAAAEADFRHALAANARNSEALYNLADILYVDHQSVPADALLQRFEALGHPTAKSLLLGYRIETRLGHADHARTYARRLRQRFPGSPQTQNLETTSAQ